MWRRGPSYEGFEAGGDVESRHTLDAQEIIVSSQYVVSAALQMIDGDARREALASVIERITNANIDTTSKTKDPA